MSRRISELDDRSIEIIQSEEQKGKRMKEKWTDLRDLWVPIKPTNIHIGNPKRRGETERGRKNMWRNSSWQFPKFDERHESIPPRNSVNPRKDIISKLLKDKQDHERVSEQTRHVQGYSVRLTSNFSSESIETRREWDRILKVLKEKKTESRILCLANLSFNNEGEIKTFRDKQKLKEFIASRLAPQKVLMRVLQTEMSGP